MYDVSFAPSCKVQKLSFDLLMLFAQYLLSAFSKVATRSPLCCERLSSTRVANVACISKVVRVSFSLERAPVGGRRFRPTLGRMEF